mmetsp:Transcript_525/g.1387  ORF Transcript_525/g.1387 Transcript_525/m.1387 type:complete len:912 (-) Transcript_525:8-2743(-)
MASNVRVVCRIRPLNRKELDRGGYSIIDFQNNYETITIKKPENDDGGEGRKTHHQFNFDKCFPPVISQYEVFQFVAEPILKDVFRGYNGTLFVYGQTGSGKTHTMMGPDGGKGMEDPEMKGIVPRIVMDIFSAVAEADENLEFMVKVSFLEIYMEKIRDLLDVSRNNLRVREDKTKGVWVEGATEVYVGCEEDVMDVLRLGQVHRSVAATKMNAESSRSHSIFIVNITQKDVTTGSTKSGKLFLVDLAGSEKVSKTGAAGQTLEEAKMINKSLTALGQVINALTDPKAKHVPYRDSKLTRLLQNSLGGNSRTTLCINCSPSDYNYGETLSTLRFGQRAKSIKNKAKVNQERSVAELMMLLGKAEGEIAILKEYIKLLIAELEAVAPGHPIPPMPKTASAAGAATPEDDEENVPAAAAGAVTAGATFAGEGSDEEDRPGAGSARGDGEGNGDARTFSVLRAELEEKVQSLEESLETSRELREELVRAKAAEEELQSETRVLVSKVVDLELLQEQLEYDGSQKNLTIEQLTSEKGILSDEVASLEKSLRDLKDRLEELQAQNARQEEALTSFSPATERRKRMRSITMPSRSSPAAAAAAAGEPAEAGAPTTTAEGGANVAELETIIAELQKENQSLQAEKVALEAAVSAARFSESAQDLESLPPAAAAAAAAADGGGGGATLDTSGLSVEEVVGRYKKLETQHHMLRKLTAKKFKEFDGVKSSLLRDLQDRAERVIDLEELLEEAREQYEVVVTRANAKATSQKKVAFLEKNLGQLTEAHEKLTNQNHRMRVECDVAQRKVDAKEKRVQQLEQQLENHKRQSGQQITELQQEVADMREQMQKLLGQNQALEQASTRAVANSNNKRIAKPIRGGGGKNTTTDPKRSGFFAGLFGKKESDPKIATASAPNVSNKM